MAKNETPPHKQVVDQLSYDQQSGVFTWKMRPRSMFNSDRAFNAFNSNFAGKAAGYCDKGYIRVDLNGGSIRAHRLAWFYIHGEWPTEIDHIDGVRTNNAISNLREVNRQENCRNRRLRGDNTTGFQGVYLTKNRKGVDRWLVKINDRSGKRVSLGSFAEKHEAITARKTAEKKLGYHENHGRTANG